MKLGKDDERTGRSPGLRSEHRIVDRLNGIVRRQNTPKRG